MCFTGSCLKNAIFKCRSSGKPWTKLALLMIPQFQYVMTIMSLTFAVNICGEYLPAQFAFSPLHTKVLLAVKVFFPLVFVLATAELFLHFAFSLTLLCHKMLYEKNLIPAKFIKVLSTCGKMWRTVAIGVFFIIVHGSGIVSTDTWTNFVCSTAGIILAYLWSMWEWHKLCTVWRYTFSNSDLDYKEDEEEQGNSSVL